MVITKLMQRHLLLWAGAAAVWMMTTVPAAAQTSLPDGAGKEQMMKI